MCNVKLSTLGPNLLNLLILLSISKKAKIKTKKNFLGPKNRILLGTYISMIQASGTV